MSSFTLFRSTFSFRIQINILNSPNPIFFNFTVQTLHFSFPAIQYLLTSNSNLIFRSSKISIFTYTLILRNSKLLLLFNLPSVTNLIMWFLSFINFQWCFTGYWCHSAHSQNQDGWASLQETLPFAVCT